MSDKVFYTMINSNKICLKYKYFLNWSYLIKYNKIIIKNEASTYLLPTRSNSSSRINLMIIIENFIIPDETLHYKIFGVEIKIILKVHSYSNLKSFFCSIGLFIFRSY